MTEENNNSYLLYFYNDKFFLIKNSEDTDKKDFTININGQKLESDKEYMFTVKHKKDIEKMTFFLLDQTAEDLALVLKHINIKPGHELEAAKDIIHSLGKLCYKITKS